MMICDNLYKCTEIGGNLKGDASLTMSHTGCHRGYRAKSATASMLHRQVMTTLHELYEKISLLTHLITPHGS